MLAANKALHQSALVSRERKTEMPCHDTLIVLAQNLEKLADIEKDIVKRLALKQLSSDAWRGYNEHVTMMNRSQPEDSPD